MSNDFSVDDLDTYSGVKKKYSLIPIQQNKRKICYSFNIMPGITVRTNIKEVDLPDDFEEKIADKASEVLKAPLELIYILVSPGNRMLNNGRKTPMIFVDISSIFKENIYDDFNKIFIPFFASLLDLPHNRVVIKYINICPTDFGMVREAPEFKHAEFYSSLKQ